MKNIFFAMIMATSTALFALPSDSSLAIAQEQLLGNAIQSDIKGDFEAGIFSRRSHGRYNEDNNVAAATDNSVNRPCSCPPGPPGSQGQKGDQGTQGNKGDKGDRGDKGDQGVKGDKGENGRPGEKGERGCKGDVGCPGPQGPCGPRGCTGATGATGPQGSTGYTGPQGDCAIDAYAVFCSLTGAALACEENILLERPLDTGCCQECIFRVSKFDCEWLEFCKPGCYLVSYGAYNNGTTQASIGVAKFVGDEPSYYECSVISTQSEGWFSGTTLICITEDDLNQGCHNCQDCGNECGTTGAIIRLVALDDFDNTPPTTCGENGTLVSVGAHLSAVRIAEACTCVE